MRLDEADLLVGLARVQHFEGGEESLEDEALPAGSPPAGEPPPA